MATPQPASEVISEIYESSDETKFNLAALGIYINNDISIFIGFFYL